MLAAKVVQHFRAQAMRDIPDRVLMSGRLHMLDAIGVGLVSSAVQAGAPLVAYGKEIAGPGTAMLIPGLTASAANAAMVNGSLIHSLEFDDTHTGSVVHGSSVLVPTALAAGEAAGASGAAVLSAYIRGWEILIRLGMAAPGMFQARGFHVTSVPGALVAALVAAELWGLDDEKCVMAMGIALSQASGLFEFLTNASSVKALHPGWAAHAGIVAARLAASGMTGPATSIDGRFGIFGAFADSSAVATFASLLEDAGQTWHLPDTAFKFYACCHYAHPYVEAGAKLRERGVTLENVTSIDCRVPAIAAQLICEPWASKVDCPTPHAARWSLPIVLATMLHEGEVSLQTFETQPSPAVRALAAKIHWRPLHNTIFPKRFEAEVDATLTNGRIEKIRIDDVYGGASRPAPEADVRAKFRSNAARAVGAARARTIEAAIDALPNAGNLAQFSAALKG